jgi:hypothetical protein
LETIRPGVRAEDVHFASLEVYQSEGFGICYRTRTRCAIFLPGAS